MVCEWMGCGVTSGRRPAGLVEPSEARLRDLGSFFAELALLEAASVDAFHVLGDELRHHGAPPSLVRATEQAARDEVRHARVAGALARRHGAEPRLPRVEKRAIRPLEDIALENAVEGCVRETYGALVAAHQARAATSPQVRAAFSRIARDETRHAALAWRVAAWLDDKLSAEARSRVRAARDAAALALALEVRVSPPRDWVEVAGLPTAPVASSMVEQMRSRLWS
jgi:hypothetical protein